jgi:hypothetical protein
MHPDITCHRAKSVQKKWGSAGSPAEPSVLSTVYYLLSPVYFLQSPVSGLPSHV